MIMNTQFPKRSSKNNAIYMFWASLFWITYGEMAIADFLLLQNVQVIDARGLQPSSPKDILIKDGIIVEVGVRLPHHNGEVLDLAGNFVVPGLIDAHTHLSYGPGSALDAPESIEGLWSTTWGKHVNHYLSAYLASGVTTVLDAGSQSFVVSKIQAMIDERVAAPRYLYLGPFLRSSGGYPNTAFDEVKTEAELHTFFDHLESIGAAGAKIPLETGFSPTGSLPVHSDAMLLMIQEEAKKRGLPLYFHATQEDQLLRAVEHGAHGLMHPIIGPGPDRDADLNTAFAKAVADAGVFQVSTLSITDSHLTRFRANRLDDPLLTLVVPTDELDAARNLESYEDSRDALYRGDLSWIPKFIRIWIADAAFTEDSLTEALARSQRAVLKMHEEGVPIVMGSDTSFHPAAGIFLFHGAGSIGELELLVDAGLTPHEAIVAATINGAQMLKIDDQVGTVEIGKIADLVVLEENPLVDISAMRHLQWVIRAGEARTPAQWMKGK